MRFWTVFRRELGAYFNSPIAAIFLIMFSVFANGLFMMQFFQAQRADMRQLFSSLPFILNIFIPAVAMRLWAEDKRGSTFELLLTFPMRPQDLVLGKYLASLVFYATALMTTATVPLMLLALGKPDMGLITGGYLGALFIGAAFLAIGIFISGLCKDQIVAFILTAVATFITYFLGTDAFASAIDGWIGGLGTFLKNSVGIASHISGLEKGVVDIRDVIFFLLTIGSFLFLNGLSLEGRFKPKARMIFAVACVVCLSSLLLAQWLVRDLDLGRFDLTEDKVNTISPASKRILSGLKAPLQAKLYISPTEAMPTPLKSLERDVIGKLEELRVVSDGNFKFRVIHPDLSEQSEEVKTRLRNEGVTPLQVESVQKDELGVKLIYSTLVLQYKEKPEEILPGINPRSLGDLEYQIMSKVNKLTMEEKPVVAVYAPLEKEALAKDLESIAGFGGEDKDPLSYKDPYKTAMDAMKGNGYEVRRIALTRKDPIPADTKLLLVLAPGELKDRPRYEIGRYLREGGTAVIAAQGYTYTFNRQLTGLEAVPKRENLDINRLTEGWGIKIGSDILLDERSQVIQLMTDQRVGPFSVQMPVKFPNQIVVDRSTMDPANMLTQRVPSILYLWGSAVDVAENTLTSQKLTAKTVFSSSPRSWTVPYDGSSLKMQDVRAPEDQLRDGFPLAVMVEGSFPDVSGGNVPAWEGESGSADVQKPKEGQVKPGRMLLIGCSKIFGDDLMQNPGNMSLFANIVDGLVLGEDLIQVRSKTILERPLRAVSNAEKIGYRFFVVLLVPILLFGASLMRSLIRRKEKEFYLAAMKAAQN